MRHNPVPAVDNHGLWRREDRDPENALRRTISTMDRNRKRAGIACLLLVSTLMLGGCNKFVSEKCSGSDHEMTCSASVGESNGQWSTELEGGEGHSTITISGTFTIAAGSGTLTLYGDGDEGMEYELRPGEPVVVEDLTLPLIQRSGPEDETYAMLRTDSTEPIEDFSAEYTFFTQ